MINTFIIKKNVPFTKVERFSISNSACFPLAHRTQLGNCLALETHVTKAVTAGQSPRDAVVNSLGTIPLKRYASLWSPPGYGWSTSQIHCYSNVPSGAHQVRSDWEGAHLALIPQFV